MIENHDPNKNETFIRCNQGYPENKNLDICFNDVFKFKTQYE